MTDNYILASAERQAEIEAAKVAFFNRGGRIKVGPGLPEQADPAPRSSRIDPETVLHRRRTRPTTAERNQLRRMVDSI